MNQLNMASELTSGELSPGVVHIGWSKFAPAFIGRMLQRAVDEGHTDMGLIAVNRTDNDPAFRNLAQQNYLYYLVECNGHEALNPIKVMQKTMTFSKERAAIIAQMADVQTKIVTLSITNSGYCVNNEEQPDTAKLDGDIQAIRRGTSAQTTTTMGAIAAALHQRFQSGMEPFVVLSCDNISYNGDMTQRVITYIASQISPAFHTYVKEFVVFPNSVVDRVTPEQDYPKQERHVSEKFGVATISPIKCEDHIELIVEDPTHDGKRIPPSLLAVLQSAKAEVTTHIKPYQDRKLKIFNAAHMICGVFGSMMRVPTVQEAMQHQSPLRRFIDVFLGEMADGLRPSQPTIDSYVDQTVERLENNSFVDHVSRLISKTSTKIDPRFFNSDGIAEGTSTKASAFAIAMWMEYVNGRDGSGNHLNIDNHDVNQAIALGLRCAESDQRPSLDNRMAALRDVLLAKQHTMVTAGEMSPDRLQEIEAGMPTFLEQISESIMLIESAGPYNALHRWLDGHAPFFPVAGSPTPPGLSPTMR